MQRRFALSLAALCLAATFPAVAQDKWPSRPIELIYPYPPGNDADAVMRLLAQGMSKRLGVPVQLINKPGGGGVVGTNEMVRARPDGYTIGTWTPGPGITQVVAGNAPYKQSDLQPVAGVFVNDFVLAARGNIPATNLKEFAAWAKANNKPVVIGSYSPASVPALIAARIARQDGWNYKVVAFGNPSAKELTAGDADVTTTGAEMVSSFVKAGQVKVVSTWMPDRSRHYPGVATLKESGHGEMYLWTGLAAPAGVPREIVNRLSEAARAALGDKEVVDMLAKLGVPPLPMTPEQMAQRIQADSKWMGELMAELGMLKK
jgi:tripartite-type tricarboxylate transporter receptor subunit TctC